jgi:hypothetical protein
MKPLDVDAGFRAPQGSHADAPGNSGGALFDMSGSVVGVVVAQLSVLQNVNFAIQPFMLINFLEVKDVTPKFRFTAKGGLPRRQPPELLALATGTKKLFGRPLI